MPVDPIVCAGFIAFVFAMLALDLFVLHRKPHAVSIREAAATSALWIGVGLAFGLLIWAWQGADAAGQYFAGYVIEKSLAVDNIFVFALIFSAFAVPAVLQHRVLFWGIVAALAFRGLFIAGGIAVLERFHWTVFVFGALLVVTGIRMLRRRPHVDPTRNRLVGMIRRVVPVTEGYEGQRFFVQRAGRLLATPLLIVLLVVEGSDLVFSVDSIPAILAVTDDPFLVFTSNALAVLGLRALYFLLAGAIGLLFYLKPALAVILVFVGLKMAAADLVTIPTGASLGVIVSVLAVATIASIARNRRSRPVDRSNAPQEHPGPTAVTSAR